MDTKVITRSEIKNIANNGVKSNVFEQEAEKGVVPTTITNQNLGHNSKKEGMGPNTKR
ncbi:MAG: hypothetical protein RR131_04030 [Anaerovorax sp.]